MGRTRIVLDPGALDRSAQRVLDLSVVTLRYRLQLNAATTTLPSMPPEVRSRVSSELAAIAADLLHVSRGHTGSLGAMQAELRATARALGAPGPKIHKLSRWWKVGDAVVTTGDFFGVNVLAYTVMGDEKKAAGQAASFGMTVFGGHIIKGIGKGGKAAMGAASGGAKASGRALSAGAGGAMKLLGSGGTKLATGASRLTGALADGAHAFSRWANGIGRLRPNPGRWNGAAGQRLERIGQAAHQGSPYLMHPTAFRHPLLMKLAKRPRPALPPLGANPSPVQHRVQVSLADYLKKHYRSRSFYANGDFRAAALMELATGLRGAYLNRWATFAGPAKQWKDHVEKVAVARRFLDKLLRTSGQEMTPAQRSLVEQELRQTDEALGAMLEIWQQADASGLHGAALDNYRDIEKALELATR